MGIKIHPTAVVEDSAKIGDGAIIGPNCYVDENAVIGSNTVLDANVVIGKSVKIGSGNTLFANCVIGRPPQLLGWTQEQSIGGLEIGDNNTVRENVTIHPSMYPGANTVIGSDNLIMVGVHIGHDCELEDKIVISNYTQVSGHCKVETGVWLSGIVAVHQFVTLGKWSYAAGLSGINHDIPPFVIVSGHYPNEVRSINKRGLNRAGLDEEQKENIVSAFKRIYKADGIFLERVKELAQESDDSNVRYMVESIIRSQEHRFGRYLESLRDH